MRTFPVGPIIPQAVLTRQSRAKIHEDVQDTIRTEWLGEEVIDKNEFNTDQRERRDGQDGFIWFVSFNQPNQIKQEKQVRLPAVRPFSPVSPET
jgi:hypothetical protein